MPVRIESRFYGSSALRANVGVRLHAGWAGSNSPDVLQSVILDNRTIGNTIIAMESLTTFSLRIPKDLARVIAAEAKRAGLSKSEYARRAMEEFNQQRMQERMAYLSTQLAAHSAAAHDEMESSIADGIA